MGRDWLVKVTSGGRLKKKRKVGWGGNGRARLEGWGREEEGGVDMGWEGGKQRENTGQEEKVLTLTLCLRGEMGNQDQ